MIGQGQKILYLDFDGVLHPSDVYVDIKNRPYLAVKNHSLFMWNTILEEALAPYPDLKIVLSTTWVRKKSFSYAKKRLPMLIQEKVIGATWHSTTKNDYEAHQEYLDFTRYETILLDVKRRKPDQWIAIDDDNKGWNPLDKDKLVYSPPDKGLSSETTLLKLKEALKSMT